MVIVIEVVKVTILIEVVEAVGLEDIVKLEDNVEVEDDVELVDDIELNDVELVVVGCPLTFGTALGPDPISTIFSEVAPNTAGARWASLLSRSNTT